MFHLQEWSMTDIYTFDFESFQLSEQVPVCRPFVVFTLILTPDCRGNWDTTVEESSFPS